MAGKEGFLAPYTDGAKRFYALVASLSETVNDNPAQVQLLAEAQQTIERRVNPLGVAEPVIQLMGTNRILVQLPGISDVEEVKTTRGYSKFQVQHEKGEGPSIMIRVWGPQTDIPVHSHPFNEMFYVLEGEVEMRDAT